MPHPLVDLIHAREAAIAERFVSLLRERRAPESSPTSALLDHMPAFLKSVARGLRTSGTEPDEETTALADAHGEERWEQGFDLREVVGDYALLHEAVLIEAREAGVTPTLEEARGLVQQINGGISAAVASFTSMHEERARAAAEQLDGLQRVRAEFLSNLSHELRTPLHAIGLGAQLLRTNAGLAGAETSLDVIQRGVVREGELVEELLEMASLVTGRVRLSWSTVDLADVVREVVGRLAPTASAKGVHLHDELPTGAVEVRGDRARLVQAVWQVLRNALGFTPRDGHVLIALDASLPEDVHGIELSIHDTGPGMTTDVIEAAFEPFVQGRSGSTRPHGGLGLGLSLVQHIVDLHGGRVEAESTEDGATVRLVFPRAS